MVIREIRLPQVEIATVTASAITDALGLATCSTYLCSS